MSLKLNSVSNTVFSATGVDNASVRVNGESISRQDIVATGRLILCEYIGKALNERPGTIQQYVSRLNDKSEYSALSQKHQQKKFMFCAAQYYKSIGKEVPSYEEAKRDLSLAGSRIFCDAYAAIDRDVIQPLFFHVFDDVGAGGLMQWEPISFGGTKDIEIRSNDVFLFEDGSWGSGRSASYNYLYKKNITLNPKVYNCQAKIKWYQDVVNGEAGEYYSALINGMWSKVYAIFMQKLTSAANNVNYIPAGLTATTYTTQNWNNITTKVAAVNGVRRNDLVAFGNIGVLSNILPTDGTGAAAVGLQYGLGEEWFRKGYLPNASGVQLIEVMPAVVPGTQNSTIDLIGTGDNLFVAAKAGYGYAPIIGGYYEGSPITLTLTPSETADFTIDINVQAMFDVKELFASKVGVITNAGANE